MIAFSDLSTNFFFDFFLNRAHRIPPDECAMILTTARFADGRGANQCGHNMQVSQ